VRNGERELVLQSRRAYQRTMGAELIASVEEITGRRVRAFLSDNHIDPDYAVESFVLAHESDEDTDEQPAARLGDTDEQAARG
jgi:uncharacterized protein YbcI